MRRLTSACLPARKHWWMALCSLSTGSSSTLACAGGGHHDFTGGDEDFLVRKRDLLSGFHGGVRGFEAHDADGRGNQRRGGGMRGHSEHAAAPC